jgi:hypothetical protein
MVSNDNNLTFDNDGDDLIDGGIGFDTLTGQGGVLVSFNLFIIILFAVMYFAIFNYLFRFARRTGY